jgi:hypothetical protein
MSDKPDDDKILSERVALGEKAPSSPRRAGAALARSGQVMACVRRPAAVAAAVSKTGKRAVRLPIPSSPEAD